MTAPITNQANIKNAFGDIVFENKFSTQDEFIDPTDDLPHLSKPKYTSKESSKFIENLKNERVLTVSCFSRDVLETIAYTITSHDYFNNLQKRELRFNQKNLSRTDISLEMFKRQKIGANKDVIIIIYLDDRRFLDSMFELDSSQSKLSLGTSKSFAASFTQQFKEKNFYVVALISDHEIINTLKSRVNDFAFPCWQVSFLKFMLLKYFDDTLAEFYMKDILSQKAKGLWGNTEFEFFDRIHKHLEVSPRKLVEEIEKRKEHSRSNQAITEFIEKEIESIKPEDIVKQGGDTVKHICFIATYFPDLKIKEFGNLVDNFLDDDNKFYEVIEKEVVTVENDKSETIEKKLKQTSLKEWKQNPDRILQKAYLRTFKNDTGLQTIDFQEPYLRDEFREFFETEPFYLFRQFDYLFFNNGILFDLSNPSKIVDSFIKFCAYIATSDPSHFGKDKLLFVTTSIGNAEFNFRPNFNELSIQNLFMNLMQAFEKIRFENYKNETLVMIARLVFELIQFDNLKDIIHDFWNTLISSSSQHKQVAFRIIEYLRYTPNFDKFYWIKQLLDRGGDIKDEVFMYLVRLVQNTSSFKVYPMLETIASWHPDKERPFQNFSPSNYSSLSFILHYSIDTVNKVRFDEYGLWQSRYPLFISLYDASEEDIKSKICFIVRWLFHPNLLVAYQKVSDDVFITEERLQSLIADITEQWLHILYGLEHETHPVALKVINIILTEINILTSQKPKHKLILIKNWASNAKKYLDSMKKLSVKQRKEKMLLKKRRDVTRLMIKKFKELSK